MKSVFKSLPIAILTLVVATASYPLYSKECLMLDSEFGESPSQMTESGADEFAKTVPKEDLQLPDKVTGEFESSLSAEMTESELVTSLDSSLFDAEGIAGFVAGCVASVPEAISVHENQYATALDKASADLSCIPVVGQILGFVDQVVKYEKQQKEIKKVNRLVDKLNSANGLNLDDSDFKEHKSIDNWIVTFKLKSANIPGELRKTLESYYLHLKYEQESKLSYNINAIAEHFKNNFFDDNKKIKTLIDKARNKKILKEEINRLVDDIIMSYADFKAVDKQAYQKTVSHMIATSVVSFRRSSKSAGNKKINSSIDDATAKLNKYIDALLDKIADVREYEYKLKNNLNEKGQSLESSCWDGKDYYCKYFQYERENDNGVGGWVQRKKEIMDYTKNYTVKAMNSEWKNLDTTLNEYVKLIEKSLYSKVIKTSREIDLYHNSFKATILADAGFGDASRYKQIIRDSYIATSGDNGFGQLNVLYRKIFADISRSLERIESESSSRQYVSGASYEYGKVYSKRSASGKNILYRYLGDNHRPITDLKSNEDWDLIGSNTIVTDTNGISKYDIAKNSTGALFEFIGNKKEGLNIPSKTDSGYGKWNFIGYKDNQSILPSSVSVDAVVKFKSSGLNVGDVIARRDKKDGVWQTSYYVLMNKDSAGNYASVPDGNYSNANWKYSGQRIPMLKSWSYGNEVFRENGDAFQLLFPRYATNKKIHAKYGDYLDSIYLSWTNPVTGLRERTHSVGGSGGDIVNSLSADYVGDDIKIYYGRNFTSDSIVRVEINYNSIGRVRSSPNTAFIENLCNISGITGTAGNMIDRIGFFNQCQ